MRYAAARRIITRGSNRPIDASCFVQTPCQQDRRGNFVELQTRPIGGAIDPAILRETAVRSPEPRARSMPATAFRSGRLREARCALPGRASRRGDNHRDRHRRFLSHPRGCSVKRPARLGKPFVREQNATAQPIHSTAIGRILAEIEFGIHNGALPLPNIPLAMRLERLGQRLEQLRRGARIAATIATAMVNSPLPGRSISPVNAMLLPRLCGTPSPF